MIIGVVAALIAVFAMVDTAAFNEKTYDLQICQLKVQAKPTIAPDKVSAGVLACIHEH